MPIASTLTFWGIDPRAAARVVPALRVPTAPPPAPFTGPFALMRLALSPAIEPPWLPQGSVIAVPVPSPPPPAGDGGGEVLARGDGPAGVVPLIVRRGGELHFPLPPDALVGCILEERYRPARRAPLALSIPGYHRVPGALRMRIFRAMNSLARRAAPPPPFPSWPFDPSVEAVRHAVAAALRLATGEALPAAPFWPGGKRWAAALTHDVDTADGFRRTRDFAEMEAARGLPACYNIVARGYPIDDARLAALRGAGMEIGLHGDVHDNRIAFLPPVQIGRRLEAVGPFMERWGVEGFRSPSLLRTEALHRALAARFLYDSSVPDTETTTTYPRYAGCCTVFPFVRHGILELPLTVPMDSSLRFLGYAPRDILSAWIAKLETIRSLGGLAVVTTHTDRHFSGNREMLSVYARLLDRLGAAGDVWIAPPREIARWWRRRTAA